MGGDDWREIVVVQGGKAPISEDVDAVGLYGREEVKCLPGNCGKNKLGAADVRGTGVRSWVQNLGNSEAHPDESRVLVLKGDRGDQNASDVVPPLDLFYGESK